MRDLLTILEGTGIPYAYDHFAEGESPEPPFITFLTTASDNFSADGIVYHQMNVIHVELYTDEKDPMSEQKVQEALNAAGIFWQKSEVWIESEQLYEVLYSFEMEESTDAEEE